MDNLIGKTFRIIKKSIENRVLYDIVIKILPPKRDIMYYTIEMVNIYSDNTGICKRLLETGLGLESALSYLIRDFVEEGKVEHNLGEYKFIINEPLSEKINKILSL